MNSLEQLCIKQVADSKFANLENKINHSCYDKFVNYQMAQGFSEWKRKAKLLEIEMNIDDMEVSYDMHFDEPCHFIFIKFKKGFNDKYYEEDEMDEEEEYEEEYELFRNEWESPLYNIYFEIAKKRGLIEEEEY